MEHEFRDASKSAQTLGNNANMKTKTMNKKMSISICKVECVVTIGSLNIGLETSHRLMRNRPI